MTNLGVDETSFLKANRHHATRYATGLVDLDRRMVIDMVEGNAAADLRRWCSLQDPAGSDIAADLGFHCPAATSIYRHFSSSRGLAAAWSPVFRVGRPTL